MASTGWGLARAAAFLATLTSAAAARTAMGVPAVADTYEAGDLKASARSSPSSGWLLCDGSAVSRTTYATLFAAIGTAYGAGNGTTTFNVPDLRGRTLVGRDNLGGTAANRVQVATTITTSNGSASSTVGSASGLCVGMFVLASTVPAGVTISAISGTTVTLSSGTSVTAGTATAVRFSLFPDPQTLGSAGGAATHQLVTAQMPAHTHSAASRSDRNTSAGGSENVAIAGGPATLNTNSTGGDQPHPNLQPSYIVNYFIKT